MLTTQNWKVQVHVSLGFNLGTYIIEDRSCGHNLSDEIIIPVEQSN